MADLERARLLDNTVNSAAVRADGTFLACGEDSFGYVLALKGLEACPAEAPKETVSF